MKTLLSSLLLLITFVVGASVTLEDDARAAGPANCPAGQTALAQKYGTSQYCALNVCVAEFQHADLVTCNPPDVQHPFYWGCISTKYEARPRFPQPPSPSGAWGLCAPCPSGLNTATWY